MTGWAYLDAQYQNSPAFVDGSAPINTPKNTANGWLNYRFNEGILNGLDLGAGAAPRGTPRSSLERLVRRRSRRRRPPAVHSGTAA